MTKGLGYDWIIGGDIPPLGRHSVAKHEVFDRYVEAYIRTLTKSHLTRALKLTIVDGFCGGGRYTLDGAEVDGSPLRMLASVQRIQAEIAAVRSRGISINVDFVFIDINDNHRRATPPASAKTSTSSPSRRSARSWDRCRTRR